MHTSALPFFGLIRVSGEDRASFLHGQLSNHIEGLAEGEACYATYNTPKGRVIANMLVFNRGEDLLLLTAADLVEALCKRLRMFVLRAKAVFEPLPGYGAAGRLNEGATALPAAEPHLSFPFETASSNVPCPTAASCWPAKKTNCPPMMPKRKTPGSCTKSAAATRGFQRRPKKAASPKCSTSTP